MCLLSVGVLKVNVSKGRMSLRTAMVVSSDEHKRNLKARLYGFADCNGCGLLRTEGKIEKRYCMSLRTAMIVSCYEHKGKSKSNIVCLCRLQ